MLILSAKSVKMHRNSFLVTFIGMLEVLKVSGLVSPLFEAPVQSALLLIKKANTSEKSAVTIAVVAITVSVSDIL